MERITFDLVSLRHEKVTESLESFLELRNKSVHWKVKFYADKPKDEDDLKLGWENNFVCMEVIVLKKYIAGFSKTYHKVTGLWSIYFCISGVKDDISIFCKREDQADKLFEKLDNYLHNGD